MKWLAVFVSYNFAHYLRNAVASCREFFPDADVLVVDNGSTNSAMHSLLRELESDSSIMVRRRANNDNSRKVGSLYDGYNEAIDYALERNYELILFANDDVQFVRSDPTLAATVRRIYELAPNTSNVDILFSKRIAPRPLASLDAISGTAASLERTSGISDNGFLSADFLRRTGFRFLSSEHEHSRQMLDKGFRMAKLHAPVLAYVPWVATRREGRVIGHEAPPPRKYYLKPFSAEESNRLINAELNEIPTFDDWCRPWGWSCLRPFWATTFSPEYTSICWRGMRAGDTRLRPHFVSERGPVSLLSAVVQPHEPRFGFATSILLKAGLRKLLGPAWRRARSQLRRG
jgi:hypothetical protein